MLTTAKQSPIPTAIRRNLGDIPSGGRFYTKSAKIGESGSWLWSARIYARVGKSQMALLEATDFMSDGELTTYIAAGYGSNIRHVSRF